MKGAVQAAGFGKESVWGTPVAPTTTLLLVDSGVQGDDQNDITPVLGNASFPEPHSQELMAQRHRVNIETPVYPAQFDALWAIGHTRDATSKDVEPYTIVKNMGLSGEGDRWIGCKCASMSLRWSNDGFVMISHEMVAKQRDNAVFSPGSYPSGHPYHGHRVAVTVNGVAATKVFSGEITINNNLEEGPIDEDYLISFLEAGFREKNVNIVAAFVSDEWNALVRDLTNDDLVEFTVEIVLQDIGASPTNKTITISNCRAISANQSVSDQGSTVQQTLVATNRSAITIT